MINEAAFRKEITSIDSQEDFVKIIKKCLKNNIPVTFDMPFMSAQDRKELESGPYKVAWRYQPNFNYQDFHKRHSTGRLKYLSNKNKYVNIQPDDGNLVSDDRLDFHTLYQELERSPEDFKMFIDGKPIEFGGVYEASEWASRWDSDHDPDADLPEKIQKTYEVIGNYLKGLDQVQIEQKKEEIAQEYSKEVACAVYDHWSPEQLKAHIDDAFIEDLVNDPEEGIAKIERLLHALDMYDIKANAMMESAMKKVTEKESKGAEDFKKIEKKAEKEYGSKKAGEKVAGKVKAEIAKKKKVSEEEKDTDVEKSSSEKVSPKEKFVIELTFPYDGDDDLANAVEEQLSKKAEVNEVVRTRRIMEFDYKNQSMFSAAMKTIQNIMNEKGKTDYKLDSRTEEDTGDSSIDSSSEEKIEEKTYDDWKTMTPDEEEDERSCNKKKDEEFDESASLKESIDIIVENDRFPITVTLPFLIETLAWAAKNQVKESEIYEYALKIVDSYNDGDIIDLD